MKRKDQPPDFTRSLSESLRDRHVDYGLPPGWQIREPIAKILASQAYKQFSPEEQQLLAQAHPDMRINIRDTRDPIGHWLHDYWPFEREPGGQAQAYIPPKGKTWFPNEVAMWYPFKTAPLANIPQSRPWFARLTQPEVNIDYDPVKVMKHELQHMLDFTTQRGTPDVWKRIIQKLQTAGQDPDFRAHTKAAHGGTSRVFSPGSFFNRTPPGWPAPPETIKQDENLGATEYTASMSQHNWKPVRMRDKSRTQDLTDIQDKLRAAALYLTAGP